MFAATASAKAAHIRKVLSAVFASVVVCSSAPIALALDPMGPPVAEFEQGQFKAGLEFSYSEMDLEVTNGTFIEFLDGVDPITGELIPKSFTLKNFEAAKTFANLGYGFTDNVEGFLRIGGTRAEFVDSLWVDSEEFESGSNLAIGAGLKAFIELGGLKVGGIIQGSYAEYQGELDAPQWPAPDFVEIDLTEVQLALGASYTTWSFSIYGGPFLHLISGDLYDNETLLFIEEDTEVPGLLNTEYVWDLDEDSIFGGYIGAQLEVAEGCSVNVEYQKTAAADAFGASIFWRF